MSVAEFAIIVVVSAAELAHKRHTKPSRLGGGPFVAREQEAWAARHLFLTAIEQHCPAVLESLCDDVLLCYQADDGSYDAAVLGWGRRWNLTKGPRKNNSSVLA